MCSPCAPSGLHVNTQGRDLTCGLGHSTTLQRLHLPWSSLARPGCSPVAARGPQTGPFAPPTKPPRPTCDPCPLLPLCTPLPASATGPRTLLRQGQCCHKGLKSRAWASSLLSSAWGTVDHSLGFGSWGHAQAPASAVRVEHLGSACSR